MQLPPFKPMLLPAGIYIGEVSNEVTEAPSQFDSSKTFLKIPMLLKSASGDWRPFTWTVGPTTALYGEFLKTIGGKLLPSGIIDPPKSFFKRPFLIELKQIDSKRYPGQIVNQVVSFRVYTKSSAELVGGAEDEPSAANNEEEPEALEGPLEDAPF